MNPLSLTPAPLLGLALYLSFPEAFPQAVAWACLSGLTGFIILSNRE